MSHTELLFRNLQNGVPISYEKFKAAGWEVDDYLEYLGICEEIRSFCICDEALNYVPGIKNLELVKTRYFYELVDRLSTFLSKFFGRQYYVPFERSEFDIYENWSPILADGDGRYASLIPCSSEEFRHQIEMAVSDDLKADDDHAPEIEITAENIEETIQRMEDALAKNVEPKMPEDLNSYAVLQKWADAYYAYTVIDEECDSTIETLKQELKRLQQNQKRGHPGQI